VNEGSPHATGELANGPNCMHYVPYAVEEDMEARRRCAYHIAHHHGRACRCGNMVWGSSGVEFCRFEVGAPGELRYARVGIATPSRALRLLAALHRLRAPLSHHNLSVST
jgi:hypothetical protein